PHELGHGAFNLRHTFSEEATHLIEEGRSDNLMDYGRPPGTKLWKYQWDLIHDPEGVLFAWTEEKEEGESHDLNSNELIDWIKRNKEKGLAKFDRNKFYNFNYWGNKAIEAKLEENTINVYSEVFENGDVNLRNYIIDFVVDNNYHTGFNLSYQYTGNDEDAIRIWTYSYDDFSLILKELGYTLSSTLQNKIITTYTNYLSKSGNDCNKVDVVFETIPDFVLEEIELADRIKYLSVLMDCKVFDGGWIWGGNLDTDESSAIKNLLNMDASNHGALFRKIFESKTPNGHALYAKLIERLKHDELTVFAADMLRWMNNSSLGGIVQDSIPLICWNDDRPLIWDERDFSFNSNGNMNISINTQWLNEDNGTIKNSYTSYENINPLQPVAVRIENLSSTEPHSTRVINGMKEGDEYVMPAFVFAWMIEHHDKLENEELVKGGIMLASMFVNINSFGAAGTMIARSFAVGNIFFDMGEVFFGNNNLREQIRDLEGGSEFIDAWDNITKHYSRVTFSYFTLKGDTELFNTFIQAWDELVDKNIDIKIKIGKDNFKTINEFCTIELNE
ncbi:MAG: hypothetical protein R6U46_03970, partial [Marinilabilia sp.]